jgi:histidinol phosphatase-like enzyme
MLLQAAVDLNIDLAGSAMIGDSIEDMQAAEAAGVPLRIRIDPEGKEPTADDPAHRSCEASPTRSMLCGRR